jgi:hypothetical protein
MTKKIFALIVIALVTSSCTLYHVTSVDQTEAYFPPKASIDEVAYLENIEGKDYTVIGTVTVNGERRQRFFDDVIIKMRREAAIIGGDAITDIKTDATGVWKKLPAHEALKNAYVRANFTASVVVFGKIDTGIMKAEEPVVEETAPEDLTAEDPKTPTEPVTEEPQGL